MILNGLFSDIHFFGYLRIFLMLVSAQLKYITGLFRKFGDGAFNQLANLFFKQPAYAGFKIEPVHQKSLFKPCLLFLIMLLNNFEMPEVLDAVIMDRPVKVGFY